MIWPLHEILSYLEANHLTVVLKGSSFAIDGPRESRSKIAAAIPHLKARRDEVADHFRSRERQMRSDWDSAKASELCHNAESHFLRSGLSLTESIRDAADMVASAYALADMETLRYAVKEFIWVIQGLKRERDYRTSLAMGTIGRRTPAG